MSVESFIKNVSQATRFCRNEAELARLFLNAFEKLTEEIKGKGIIRVEEFLIKGRADARIGFLVFEFKEPGRLADKSERQKAWKELERHLHEYVEKGLNREELMGILSDGVWIATASYNPSKKKFTLLDKLERTSDPEHAFCRLDESALIFDHLLRGLTTRELSPDNLLEEFGPGSPVCKNAVNILWFAFKKNFGIARVKALYDQWKLFFSLSTGKVASGKDLAETLEGYGLSPANVKEEEDVRHFLFMVHTYYSLILKSLAFAIADELKLIGPISLLKGVKEDPIRGLEIAESTFPQLAVNVVEEDLFSWFRDAWNNELAAIIINYQYR